MNSALFSLCGLWCDGEAEEAGGQDRAGQGERGKCGGGTDSEAFVFDSTSSYCVGWPCRFSAMIESFTGTVVSSFFSKDCVVSCERAHGARVSQPPCA